MPRHQLKHFRQEVRQLRRGAARMGIQGEALDDLERAYYRFAGMSLQIQAVYRGAAESFSRLADSLCVANTQLRKIQYDQIGDPHQ